MFDESVTSSVAVARELEVPQAAHRLVLARQARLDQAAQGHRHRPLQRARAPAEDVARRRRRLAAALPHLYARLQPSAVEPRAGTVELLPVFRVGCVLSEEVKHNMIAF